MDYSVKGKKALKFIKQQASQLPDHSYEYNIYGLITLPSGQQRRVVVEVGTNKINHKRRMWRKYKNSIKKY